MAQRVHESIEVQAPLEDVFRYWSNFENFSKFMQNVEEVPPARTRVDVTMNYSDPPGGAVGEAVANVLSNPERNLKEDLENFAKIVERGELGGPDAQPLGSRRSPRGSGAPPGRLSVSVSMRPPGLPVTFVGARRGSLWV